MTPGARAPAFAKPNRAPLCIHTHLCASHGGGGGEAVVVYAWRVSRRWLFLNAATVLPPLALYTYREAICDGRASVPEAIRRRGETLTLGMAGRREEGG